MLIHTDSIRPADPLALAYRAQLAGFAPPPALPLPAHTNSRDVYVLSFGAGQESTALLYLTLHDADFRARFTPGRLVAVTADTGNEHPATLLHLAFCRRLCKRHGVEFHTLDAGGDYHSDNWPTLPAAFRRYDSIGSVCYPRVCTQQLKIAPIYRWLEAWLGEEYGVVTGRKRGLYQFVEEGGRLTVILGLAAGEEERVGDRNKEPLWMQRNIYKSFPLIELGLDRAGCQRLIRQLGYPLCPPSNCMMCHFMSPVELLWLYRFYPEVYADWVALEQAKREKWAHKGAQNYGVFGRRTLPEALAAAQEKHGHLSDEDLCEWKMSHGHCVRSRY